MDNRLSEASEIRHAAFSSTSHVRESSCLTPNHTKKTMNFPHLIRMANQMGTFFVTMPDRAQAEKDLAAHIKRFWEPRMRRALLTYIVEQEDGSELDEIVLTAVKAHHALMRFTHRTRISRHSG